MSKQKEIEFLLRKKKREKQFKKCLMIFMRTKKTRIKSKKLVQASNIAEEHMMDYQQFENCR